MNVLNDFIPPYIELEENIRELINSMFSESCSMCTACCCRADVCEEVEASAFLSHLLTRQERTPADMDDRYGWLDMTGCSLEFGRPPVCYTYFCGDLLHQLDEDAQLVVLILGRLIEYIGEHALGDWSLTEIAHPEDLEKLNEEALLEKLAEATEAYEIIESFTRSGRLTTAHREQLEAIGFSNEA